MTVYEQNPMESGGKKAIDTRVKEFSKVSGYVDFCILALYFHMLATNNLKLKILNTIYNSTRLPWWRSG